MMSVTIYTHQLILLQKEGRPFSEEFTIKYSWLWAQIIKNSISLILNSVYKSIAKQI